MGKGILNSCSVSEGLEDLGPSKMLQNCRYTTEMTLLHSGSQEFSSQNPVYGRSIALWSLLILKIHGLIKLHSKDSVAIFVKLSVFQSVQSTCTGLH